MAISNTNFYLHAFSMEKGGHYPVPSDFYGIPYPQGKGYDHTFLKNDCKGWGNNYLDPLPGENHIMKTGRGW